MEFERNTLHMIPATRTVRWGRRE